MRTKSVFVAHRSAVSNVIAHVLIIATCGTSDLNFAQNGKRPRSPVAPLRIMDEIDTRLHSIGHVYHADSDQPVVTEIEKLTRKLELAVDECRVVFVRCRFSKWPPPSLMHVTMIVVVQTNVVACHRGWLDDDSHVGVPTATAALTFGQFHFRKNDPQAAALPATAANRTKKCPTKSSPASFEKRFEPFAGKKGSPAILEPRRPARQVRTLGVRTDDNKLIRPKFIFVDHGRCGRNRGGQTERS